MEKGLDHNGENQEDFTGNKKAQETEKINTNDVAEPGADQSPSDTEPPVRTGKRPRIRKPLFSVPFSKE